MPFRPEQSLLSVDFPKIHTIDTHNVQNLFGMWSVFSKCAEVMENGKRLENMSWRLWNRETFCCAPEQQLQSTSCPEWPLPRRSKIDSSVPSLSSSVESDESSEESTSSSLPSSSALEFSRPELRRHDSTESWSRGRERHISPVDLEKIMSSIKDEDKLKPLSHLPKRSSGTTVHLSELDTSKYVTSEPRSSPHPEDRTPRSSSPRPLGPDFSASTVASTVPTTLDSQSSSESTPLRANDSDSNTTDMSSHSIVRGFSVGQISSSYRSSSQAQLSPEPMPILRKSKPKGAMFQIGGSSDEPESSLDIHMSHATRSSLSEGLKRPAGSKKQTSFMDEVTTRTIKDAVEENEDVFESDEEEEEEVSESAIDDDEDEDDWEDDGDDSGPSSLEDKQMFQRVESKPNLVSRRSLLTTMIHEPERAAALQNAASRSTPALRRSRTSTPNGPSLAASPDDEESGLEMKGKQIPQPKPIIMTTSNTHQPALSPRTTRRNMLSTELTESLRKNLLWERQQKNSTSSAALKRRHTSYDVKSLQQYPGETKIPKDKGPHMDGESSDHQSWNDYFDQGLQDFHRKGW
ncbi:MAG: hypothetical protein M1821_003970 [Bathelium mastoideum]|nr:MAG: hypothetical protein M1821_003970 [Bathelium mastoideum]KAI9691044.1 MAG: hypothetical protein M1822_008664 [Bathelium mastoideum]